MSTEAINIVLVDKVAVVYLSLAYVVYAEPYITSCMFPSTY